MIWKWISGDVYNCLKMERIVLESMTTLKLLFVKNKGDDYIIMSTVILHNVCVISYYHHILSSLTPNVLYFIFCTLCYFQKTNNHHVIIVLPSGTSGKYLPVNSGAADAGSIPRSGRSPGGGHSNPLQNFCLENPMDRGAWWAIVHRVVESDITEVT